MHAPPPGKKVRRLRKKSTDTPACVDRAIDRGFERSGRNPGTALPMHIARRQRNASMPGNAATQARTTSGLPGDALVTASDQDSRKLDALRRLRGGRRQSVSTEVLVVRQNSLADLPRPIRRLGDVHVGARLPLEAVRIAQVFVE